MNIFSINLGNIFSSFLTVAEKKAIINIYIIPFILTVITSNLVYGLLWVMFLSLIYVKVEDKKENGIVFFYFLKYTTLFVLFVAILLALLFI
jgi:hypothetical protein